jgi:D-threo-aldose 1-dehydrogenase
MRSGPIFEGGSPGMSQPLTPHPLGRGPESVSPLCLGTSGWGRLRDGEAPADRAARTIQLADFVLARHPELNVLDTSNIYGEGESERMIGTAIDRLGGLPAGQVIMTKVDRDPVTGEFTGEGMWRSLEESMDRLNLPSIQVLFLHDPEHIGFEASMAHGGPVDALIAMKERGLARSIGISGGPVPMLQRFVDLGVFDHLISHNRFTLIDRSAADLYAAARDRGMGVVNAAPYGGGALSGRPGSEQRYGYRDAPALVREAIHAMSRACAVSGVSLSAAALQFSMRSPLVHTTVVGASSLDRLEAAIDDAGADIPDTLWADLDALAPAGFALDSPAG